MIGEYLRITADELDRAVSDPDWALQFADDLTDALDLAQDAGDEWDGADLALAKQRRFSTYKAWDAIRFLLARVDFPVNVVLGEGTFAEDTDWGYAPARYLSVERVQVAATALAGMTFDDLVRGVAVADLAAADVYPQGWDEPDALDWVRGYYESLVGFFASAAAGRQAILTWLS
jgi:hypothetical protein